MWKHIYWQSKKEMLTFTIFYILIEIFNFQVKISMLLLFFHIYDPLSVFLPRPLSIFVFYFFSPTLCHTFFLHREEVILTFTTRV